MIDIISISDDQTDLVKDRGLIIVCGQLPELPPLSHLRKYLGNSEEVVNFYKSTTLGRQSVAKCVEMIEEENANLVAFSSEHGLYRSPAMAYLVAQELCELGHRVLLSHYKLPVPAEELVPTRRSWGEYNS